MTFSELSFLAFRFVQWHLWILLAWGMHVFIDMLRMQSVHVVTSAAFHPQNSDLLGYSTTKTLLSIVDLRQKDIRGDGALAFANSPNMVRFKTPSGHFVALNVMC